MPSLSVCMYACMHVCMHACMHACIHTKPVSMLSVIHYSIAILYHNITIVYGNNMTYTHLMQESPTNQTAASLLASLWLSTEKHTQPSALLACLQTMLTSSLRHISAIFHSLRALGFRMRICKARFWRCICTSVLALTGTHVLLIFVHGCVRACLYVCKRLVPPLEMVHTAARFCTLYMHTYTYTHTHTHICIVVSDSV
jgi:hypothetical protein